MLVIFRKFIGAVILLVILSANADSDEQNKFLACHLEKITFDVNRIDGSGMRGGANVDYEFCIPGQDKYLKEIINISPSIHCSHGEGGRIGCTKDEYLCIGNTHDKNFKSTLCQLSARDYIKQIDECFWE